MASKILNNLFKTRTTSKALKNSNGFERRPGFSGFNGRETSP